MIAKIPPNRPNLITGPAAVCLASLALLASQACVIERTTRTGSEIVPRAVSVERLFEAELDGRAVGRVELLCIDDASGAQRYYRVTHADGQLAGYIDLTGRAWRYEPFEHVLGRARSRERDASGQPIEIVWTSDRNLVLAAMDGMEENLRVLLELRRAPVLREVMADGLAAR